jgi:hypothetical protein
MGIGVLESRLDLKSELAGACHDWNEECKIDAAITV